MSKIYCVGDPHGDYDILVHLLTQSEIINQSKDWIAGDAQIVCIGDLSDRGDKSIAVIELMIRLETQAKETGGSVVSLCGNHCALIIAMAGEMSGEPTDAYCYTLFQMNGGKEEDARHLSENPKMLEWMRNRPQMHKIGRYLFQHADSVKYYCSLGDTIEKINETGLQLLKTGKGAYQIFYQMTDSRYWDGVRGKDTEQYVSDWVKSFDCEQVIHGHTRFIGNSPVYSFNNLVINVDGSMSNGYRRDAERGFILELDNV